MKRNAEEQPRGFVAAVCLIVVNAALWLVFAVIVAAQLHPAMPDNAVIRWGMGLGSLLTAGVLVTLAALLHRRIASAFWPTLALLLAIALLTFADQFGLADLVVVSVTLAPVTLLVRKRNWYFGHAHHRRP